MPPRTENRDQMAQVEAKLSLLQEQLKRLTEAANPNISSTATTGTSTTATDTPSQKKETQTTGSAEERPPQPASQRGGNGQPPMQYRSSPSSQPPLCWQCSLPGHISRNCPTKRSGLLGPPPTSYMSSRGSRNMQDKANVYIKMKLMGKEVPCLVDSGCDLTVVPKSLTDRFRRLEVKPSSHSIWAANNTPIRIHGEAELPFFTE